MTKTFNLTGQRFNSLGLISRCPENKAKSAFRCDCGALTEKWTQHAKRSSTKSCGCEAAKRISAKRSQPFVKGARYGMLTAVETTDSPSKWLFNCQCGKSKVIAHKHVRQGETLSCGCYSAKNTHQRGQKSRLLGKRYGRLVAVEVPVEGAQVSWQCDCGTIKEIDYSGVIRNRVFSCGCLTRGDDSLSAWILGNFRLPESKAMFYVFGMAKHAELSKPGIASSLKNRVDMQYGELYDFIELPRLDVWLIEQAVLWETRSSHTCPSDLSDWHGRTELRKLVPAALFEMACGYHEQLQLLGREEFAIRYLPTTPKQREQLEAMKPQLVAA